MIVHEAACGGGGVGLEIGEGLADERPAAAPRREVGPLCPPSDEGDVEEEGEERWWDEEEEFF